MNFNREEPQSYDGWHDDLPVYREEAPLAQSPNNQTLDLPKEGPKRKKRSNQVPMIIVPPADITINQYNNTRGIDSSPTPSYRETPRSLQRQPVGPNFLQLDLIAIAIASMITVGIIGGLVLLSLFPHILSLLGA